jgi:hypothetical protein
MTLRRLLWIAAFLAIAFFAFRSCFGGWTTSWHQRLTVTVETPSGEVSGAAVTEVRVVDFSGPLTLPDARGPQATVRGEAVALEVLPGKWLFALLDGGDTPLSSAKGWTEAAYGLSRSPTGEARDFWAQMRELDRQPYDTPVPLPPEGWPLMVTFGDIADPASVQRVAPNDLAASFGPGVRLKALTLEITRARVTEGRLDGVLPWLGPHAETPLLNEIDPTDWSFEAQLRKGDFISRERPVPGYPLQ